MKKLFIVLLSSIALYGCAPGEFQAASKCILTGEGANEHGNCHIGRTFSLSEGVRVHKTNESSAGEENYGKKISDKLSKKLGLSK